MSSHEMRTPLVADDADDADDGVEEVKTSALLLNTPDHGKRIKTQAGHVQQSSVSLTSDSGRSSSFNAFVIFCLFLGFMISLYFIGKFAASGPGTDNEANFQNGVSPDRIRDHLEFYTNYSHIAGSIRDYETAVYTMNKMKEFGIPVVEIEEYEVLLAYPINRTVQIVTPMNESFTAVMQEVVGNEFAVDPTSGLPGVETFLAWSKSGDVKGPLVYANYGRLEDFEWLQKKGITIAGSIVIARYGQIFRGNKAQLAEQFGAIACIIYSDPADDGFSKGTVYPDGPWRPSTGVQRGSIWNGNGDPLTPGIPSIPGAPRLTVEQAYANDDSTYNTPLPGIPVLPLSWNDTMPLLKTMTGEIVEPGWNGTIPGVTYRYGPSSATIRVMVNTNLTTMKIWNVIGKIPGAMEPDRIILLGNHRDAWVFGGADPNSGTATLMEVAYGMGRLLQNGWQPRRSIWLCSWDAEEYALIGSTEFVEKREKQMMAQGVVYMNVDIAVTGGLDLSLQGMPSLSQVFRDVSATVSAPPPPNGTAGAATWPNTIYDMWVANSAVNNPVTGLPILDASQMGTGSDYGGFVEHLGIPSTDMTYDGDGSYEGVYHSYFDSFYWMTHFGDPDFVYHATVAKLWGTLAIRISDTPLLPFRFSDYAVVLNTALAALQNFTISQNAPLNYANMAAGIMNVTVQASSLDAMVMAQDWNSADDLPLRQLNDVLMLAERGFLFLQGVAGREWYRHMVWVSGRYNGYGAIPFASVSDAVQDAVSQHSNDFSEAQKQVDLIGVVMQQMAAMITYPSSHF